MVDDSLNRKVVNRTDFLQEFIMDYILGDSGADRGGKGKSKPAKENGDEEKHSRLFFVAIFFCRLRLPLSSAICSWVSEDAWTTVFSRFPHQSL